MSRVYVGNLPMDLHREELEDIFKEFGRIHDIDLKTPQRPPAFAFVAFEETRDAEDAVHSRDGYEFQGQRLRVEMARGAPGGGDREMRRGMDMSDKMTDYRVIVTGLPPSASWQDLKDHMRKAGDVVYTDVDHRGGGIVHYGNADDMDYALRKLDDSEFRNPFDNAPIRVLVPRDNYHCGRGRSPPRRKRSYSRSHSRSWSRSRSRDRGGRGGRGHDRDDRHDDCRGDRDRGSRHDRRDHHDDDRKDRGRRDDDDRRRD